MSQRSLKKTVVKNATVNAVRLLGSGVPALLLPPFLVRALSTDTYSAWALLLQLTMYMGMLDFGIQTAVARFVAHGEELNDVQQRDGITTTAVALLTGLGLIGITIVLIIALRMGQIFPSMPPRLVHEAKIAILLMGGSFAVGLPFSALLAVFIGLQKNEVPAAIIVGNRLLMAAGVVWIVLRHGGLVAMAAGVALSNLLSYAASYIAWHKWAAHIQIRFAVVNLLLARQIGSFCFSVAVWSAAMLMISGLDLSVVGRFDYSATAYYAVAASLTNFVTLAQSSIFAALLPASAVLNARDDAKKLGSVLIDATRYGMLLLLAMAVPLLMGGYFILRMWVGEVYAAHSLAILQVLVVANVVRLSALPYATLLLGTGEQRKVILSPLAEGVTNLVASVLGAWKFGAIGVAYGTLIGSFISVGFHFFYNLPRTGAIEVSRIALLRRGVLRPLLCLGPLGVLLLGYYLMPGAPGVARHAVALVAAVSVGVLFWNVGLLSSERRELGHALRAI